MIKSGLVVAAMMSLAVAAPAQAAQDAGLSLHNGRDAGIRSSLGGQLGLTLRLGDRQTVRGSDRLNLRMSAGPIVSRSNGKHSTANLLSASLSPGYKAELAFGGQPLATRYTKAGFAEARARGLEGQDRKGVSTLGYVAIGVGVVATVVVIAGAIVIADINDCSDGNCE
jgi:hypothetical protein